MNLLQMTLSGGVFVLLIVVVRALALHRLPKGVFLALWEMAALRLLLPFAIPVSLRVCAAPDRQMAVRAPWAVGGASAAVAGGCGADGGLFRHGLCPGAAAIPRFRPGRYACRPPMAGRPKALQSPAGAAVGLGILAADLWYTASGYFAPCGHDAER